MSVRFNVRSLLIATSWVAVLSTIVGTLVRSGLLPLSIAVYLLVVLIGALGGAAYGVAKRRPQHNRWLRAFIWAEIAGTLAWMILLEFNSTIPLPYWWILAAALSTVPAFLGACLADLLRQLVERYGGASPAPTNVD